MQSICAGRRARRAAFESPTRFSKSGECKESASHRTFARRRHVAAIGEQAAAGDAGAQVEGDERLAHAGWPSRMASLVRASGDSHEINLVQK